MLHAPRPLVYVPAPLSWLVSDGCQRFLGQAHVVLLPRVQHLDRMRQALALRIFRQPHNPCQLPPCVRRVTIYIYIYTTRRCQVKRIPVFRGYRSSLYNHSVRVSRVFGVQCLFLPLGLGTYGILRFRSRLEQVSRPVTDYVVTTLVQVLFVFPRGSC